MPSNIRQRLQQSQALIFYLSKLTILAVLILSVGCKKEEINSSNSLTYDLSYGSVGTWQVQNDTLHLSENTAPNFDIRRPASIALIENVEKDNFELSARIRCGAAADNMHGDVLLILGYQSPTQFYYTHLSGLVDDVHTGIFVVNNADRKRIDELADTPILTDRDWHNVKLIRKDDSIEVFIDGNTIAHLKTTDNTFGKGKIGVGSFDDNASFTDIHVMPLN